MFYLCFRALSAPGQGGSSTFCLLYILALLIQVHLSTILLLLSGDVTKKSGMRGASGSSSKNLSNLFFKLINWASPCIFNVSWECIKEIHQLYIKGSALKHLVVTLRGSHMKQYQQKLQWIYQSNQTKHIMLYICLLWDLCIYTLPLLITSFGILFFFLPKCEQSQLAQIYWLMMF